MIFLNKVYNLSQSLSESEMKMSSLTMFTICLISRMYRVESAVGQCKPVERSVSGKALKGHTFKDYEVKAPFECQNICENDPRCASYNYLIPTRVCELNSKTKEDKPDDFVTDEQRFYMKREGMINSLFYQ